MITKVRFVRDENGKPVLVVFMARYNRVRGHFITQDPYDMSEAAYEEWVPETNGPGFPGENLKDGVEYDKPLKVNLKVGQ